MHLKKQFNRIIGPLHVLRARYARYSSDPNYWYMTVHIGFHSLHKLPFSLLLFFILVLFNSSSFAGTQTVALKWNARIVYYLVLHSAWGDTRSEACTAMGGVYGIPTPDMCRYNGETTLLDQWSVCIPSMAPAMYGCAPIPTLPTCPAGVAGQTNNQCKPTKTQGPPSCEKSPGTHTSNPIHISTGNKYWIETDYVSAAPHGVRFSHQYNSQNTIVASTLGVARHHNYNSRIVTGHPLNGVAVYYIVRPDGTSYAYKVAGNTYTSSDADITDQLTANFDAGGAAIGWKYSVAADSSTELYNDSGQLISVTNRAGMTVSMAYSDSSTPSAIASKAGLLIRVTDAHGRQLSFVYDSSDRIQTMTDAGNGHYQYSYDANNNLASIIYPDTKKKTYLYNEPAFTGGANLPHALTGITDENNVRFASYYYNAHGKAYREYHAGDVNQYQISYSTDGTSSAITDPLGTVRTTHFTTILGVIKATGQSQPGGSGCGPASSAITYDANGNVATRTDFNGNVTKYSYDISRNLEASRTEGFGTAQARTTTTVWHPTYRLPTKVAEPLRLTTHAYDPKGSLLNKTVQATADAAGSQGMSATPVGTPRTWRYTYNDVGQVLTATGPRTDIADITTYTYDGIGNLVTVTNAAGHVTTLSNYDLNGRVGKIIDANGLTTNLTYLPRGWLGNKTVTGNDVNESTTYLYDDVGQLKKATLPDGAWIAYSYDDAHRLTKISDSLGNTIQYTLDLMGNRIKEESKDPAGILTRQTSRMYDALNRLQEVTGAIQ